MVIYKFTHIASGRCYIGQTIQDPNHRRLEHIGNSRKSPKEHHFHNALKKYGVDEFTFEVIAHATSLDELNQLEIKYVKEYDSIINGFNIREPGDNRSHNPESITRMQESQRVAHARRKANGTANYDTLISYAGSAMKGRHHTDESKAKSSKSNSGQKRSAADKAKMSALKKGKTWEEIYGLEGAAVRRAKFAATWDAKRKDKHNG